MNYSPSCSSWLWGSDWYPPSPFLSLMLDPPPLRFALWLVHVACLVVWPRSSSLGSVFMSFSSRSSYTCSSQVQVTVGKRGTRISYCVTVPLPFLWEPWSIIRGTQSNVTAGDFEFTVLYYDPWCRHPYLRTRSSRPTEPNVAETGSTDWPSGLLGVMKRRTTPTSTPKFPDPCILSTEVTVICCKVVPWSKVMLCRIACQ